MKNKRIVVVDDVQITLLAIEQKIAAENRKIELCINFDEAESAIDKLGGADFLIIDMRIDGNTISNVEIERFKYRCPNVHIAVITGDPNVTEQQVRDLGADRLFIKPIEWHALEQFLSPSDISNSAILRLKDQFARSNDFLLQVIQSMKIGVSIMDAERNVVYVNKQQKEISGDSIIYGAPCFQSFAPGAVVFCEDCPTTNKDRIVTHARPGGFYDMQCIPLMDGKKIIGHAKLSTEVTEKKRLLNLFGKMPLKDTIEGILEGIRARGFSRVRFYMVSEGGKYLIGYCAIGHKDENKGFIGKPIPVSSYQNIKTSLANGKPQVFIRHGDSDLNWLTFSHKEALNEVGDCPILSKDGKPLGLVAVDNYDEDYPDITRDRIRRLTEESVKRVGAFSGLISTAIETDLTRRKDEIRKILIDSDIEIYKQRSLQDMLQILIEKVIMVIEKYWSYAFGESDPDFIVTGHIMTNRGKWLEKIAGKGILYDNWARNANIDREYRLPRVRVFNDGKDMITDHIDKDKLWQELLTELEQENRIDDASLRYMKTLQSLCCILIKFGDEKFGTMTLQSPKPYIFNEYITDIIRGYVSKCCQPLKSLHLVGRIPWFL